MNTHIPPVTLRACAPSWLSSPHFSPYLRRAEAHHRSGHHEKGHPPRLRHVSVPTHEPSASLRFPGGLLGDDVPPVQIPRALRQAALPLAAHPQIQPETQILLAQEVTGEDGGNGDMSRLDTQTWELRVRVGGAWCECWGICVCVCVCDFCPSTPPNVLLSENTPVIQLIISVETKLKDEHTLCPPLTLWHTHTHTHTHTCANTNPVICTKTEHGSLFLLVQICSSSFLDFLHVFSFILGQSMLLSHGPESRPQILYCF